MNEEPITPLEDAEMGNRGSMNQDRPPDSGGENADQTKNCKGYGHLVVVPILDETRMLPLIDLATSLACPDHGRVVALLMATGEPEEHAFQLHQIEPFIEALEEEGQPVELVVHSSVSITRGILDATRELRADILLLDARIPAEGGAKLGTIAENIIPVSPCPVMLFRPGESESVGRIVVHSGTKKHRWKRLPLTKARESTSGNLWWKLRVL
jgi:nucleotide-binding universal stress UspA family protein